jgi:hypothetical protein
LGEAGPAAGEHRGGCTGSEKASATDVTAVAYVVRDIGHGGIPFAIGVAADLQARYTSAFRK